MVSVVFSSKNQRPITCINIQYKRFTSCLLRPVNVHLDKDGLLERQKRCTRSKRSGTMDNLLIDYNFMVCQDIWNAKRMLAWPGLM